MDLRPRLVDEFIDVILADLGFAVDPDTRARWKGKMLEKFVSNSIRIEPPLSYGTYHTDVVDAFMAKYPETEGAVEYARFAAQHVWPDARILLSVNSDPESCHTCCEGQTLHIEVYGTRPEEEDEKIAEIKENRFEELTFLAEEPNPYLGPYHQNLVFIKREFGTPEEAIGAEEAYKFEWETRRRERKAQEGV